LTRATVRASRADVSFLIVGTPRSGTTLVQRLACELPGVTVPPETEFFEWFAPALLRRRRFPLDEAALRAELQAYARRRSARGLSIDPEAIVADLGGWSTDLVELFCAIVRHLAGPANLIGEKTPSHVSWFRHLSKAMPEIKIIAVVRDPRAVVASQQGVPWGTKSHLKLAENWAWQQREVARARAALGPRVLVLRYEDVVRDPEACRSTLESFLRPPRDLDAFPDHSSGTRPELFLKWEWWKERARGPISAERVDGWRKSLTQKQVAEIVAICRREMRRFGYETEGSTGLLRSLRVSPRAQITRLRFRIGILLRAFYRRRVVRRGFPKSGGSRLPPLAEPRAIGETWATVERKGEGEHA
jgi:hypothetical protein